MKILLISGHGAGDPGACGNGYKEADLTREVVNNLAKKLKQYATVDVYNQNRNAFYDVQNGVFNISKYDYVFEVHFNASANGKGRGSECYVTTRENGITVEQAIMKNMSKFFVLRDNDSIFDGVKRTNFLVINTVKSKGISGALLETCFIDNKDDINIYQKNKDAICQGIVDGIVSGFGLKRSSTSTDNKTNTTTKPATSSDTNANKNTSIKVGDKVKVLKAVQYNNQPFVTYYKEYDVLEVKGQRAVIGKGKTVTCAINIKNIQKI